MPTKRTDVCKKLPRLKPPYALKHLPLSELARRGGRSVLRVSLQAKQPLVVTVRGKDAMVLVPRSQYDELVKLIHQLQHVEHSEG